MYPLHWIKLALLTDEHLAAYLAEVNTSIVNSSEPLSIISQIPFPELFSELLAKRSSKANKIIHTLLFNIFSLVDLDEFVIEHKVPFQSLKQAYIFDGLSLLSTHREVLEPVLSKLLCVTRVHFMIPLLRVRIQTSSMSFYYCWLLQIYQFSPF